MTAAELTARRCAPCRAGQPPMGEEEARRLMTGLGPEWTLAGDGRSIAAEYVMKGFSAAAALIAKVAGLADAEDHHPDVHLTGYRKLRLELSTHAIGGLSENDFIMAAKISALPKDLKGG